MLLLLLLSSCIATQAEIFPSPCPRIFAYDPTSNETDKWYGTITLLSDSDLLDVWLRLSFDKPSIQLGNWFGQVETSDSKEYHIRKHNFELKAHEAYQFRFFLKFDPEERAPKLLSFRLNGKLVCPEPSSSGVTRFSTNSRDSTREGTTREPSRVNTRAPDTTSRYNTRAPETTSRYNTRGTDRFSTRSPVTQTTTREPGWKDNRRVNETLGGKTNQNRVTSFNSVTSNSTLNTGSKHGIMESSLNRFNSRNTSYSQPKDSAASLGSSSQASAASHGSSYGSSVSSHGGVGSSVATRTSASSQGSFAPSQGNSFASSQASVSSYGNSVGGTSISSPNRFNAITTERTTTNYIPSDFENTRTTSKFNPDRTSVYNSPDKVVYPQDISSGYDTQNRDRNTDSNPQDYICGTALPQARPLIAYGEITHDGEFPWHAALYRAKHTRLTYFCGASLISRRYLVTAGHCLIKSRSEESFKADELIVQLGKQNLKRFNVGFQDHQVAEIIPHPQFDVDTYRNDMALLKLVTLANVTDYVRPVCLWRGSTDIELLINKVGSVVGWGYDESGVISEELMQAKMPVVSRDRCISSYPTFYRKFTWANSYCGGFANGTSPCNGDAGGGMVFPVPNSSPYNPVWQLRGLISILPATQNQLCDVTHYAVFTDIAKYLDWIESVMQ